MRSTYDMTDEEWQQEFEHLRSAAVRSPDKRMKLSHLGVYVNGRRINNSDSYCGETQYYYYIQTINSILSSIRSNQCDYCYNTDQIKDLLRFEKDRLQSKWDTTDKYFCVWLS